MAESDKAEPVKKAEETKEAAAEEPAPAEPEKPAAPEPPKELEEDAAPDKRAKLAAGSVEFNPADATLNVMPSMGGKILMSLADEHFLNLLACTRANVGVLSGRYMFEVKILENRVSMQNQKVLVRIGLSLAGSSLFLSETEDSVCFDSEGFFVEAKKRTRPGQSRFSKGMTVALLLNRDAASPNVETVSLFIDGKRACEPQKLPEAFKGKALYPTINYKSVTMQVNFGLEPLAALPFSCHMIAGAAKKDVEMSSVKEPAQGELLVPVGLPDQGVADWVDDFLSKNPSYIELSTRAIEDWAQKSGVGNPKHDSWALGRLMKAVAPVLKRNYVFMELKSNLIAKEREMALKGFPGFKKVAAVLMGEPSPEYKEKVKSLILEAKTKVAEAAVQKKKAEIARKRAAEERIKKAEAAKKARLEAAKKKTDDDKAEEKAEEAPEEASEAKPAEEDEIKMEPVELTEEEAKLWYRVKPSNEIPETVLAKAFTSFSVPEKAEGFDDITFPWQPAAGSTKHLTDYILSRKLTCRVEDLQPGEWFKENSKKFQTWLATLKKRQNEWKNPGQRKALIAKIIAEKKKAEKAEDGEEKKEEGEKKEEEPVELPKVDADDLNPLEVDDVMDLGSGEPLFSKFEYEDWEMLTLRAELLLLVHAFKKDMDDPERTGFHKSHAAFYYTKYFKKQVDFKHYGQSTIDGLIALVKDAIVLNSQDVLESILPDDAPNDGLVKLTEEHRRDRSRRVDAGDETAELKFKKHQPQQQGSWAPAAKRPYGGNIQPANKYPRSGGYQPIRR